MAPLRVLVALSLVGSVASFTTGVRQVVMRPDVVSGRSIDSSPLAASGDVFEEGTEQFKEDFPVFASWGWGPSVQAEKWNGRHAMFGWVMICLTSYAHGHNLIPNPAMQLDVKQWGSLALVSAPTTITNERAVILFANVHFFVVSLFATISPLPFWDRLLIDPEEDEPVVEQYGAFPEYRWGITPEAEMINGRLAMFGLIAVILQSFITGKPIIDVINLWLGNAYYPM